MTTAQRRSLKAYRELIARQERDNARARLRRFPGLPHILEITFGCGHVRVYNVDEPAEPYTYHNTPCNLCTTFADVLHK